MQGWDGETNVEVASPIIPSGPAGWELGTDKQPKGKADHDYEQRTKDPLHLVPAETTFVFATLRRWAKKAEWQKAKKAEGIWKDVRVIDAVDLVQWLERFPAVALWFAHQIGILPPDVSTLEQVWREWSLSTTPPLSVSLVLADRDDNATQIWQWLLKQPSVFALQADAPIEAKAFLTCCGRAVSCRLSRFLSFQNHRRRKRGRCACLGGCGHAPDHHFGGCRTWAHQFPGAKGPPRVRCAHRRRGQGTALPGPFVTLWGGTKPKRFPSTRHTNLAHELRTKLDDPAPTDAVGARYQNPGLGHNTKCSLHNPGAADGGMG